MKITKKDEEVGKTKTVEESMVVISEELRRLAGVSKEEMRVGRAVQEGMLKSAELVMEKFSTTRGDREESHRSSMTAVQKLNSTEKLNNEGVKDVNKFRAWMTKFTAYLCASAQSGCEVGAILKIIDEHQHGRVY